MQEENYGYQEEEISGILYRYESMRRNNENLFFDVSEFETIIDYYLENNDVTFAFEAAESATRQHPNSVSIQLKKAKVLIDKGRAVEALKAVKFLEKIEPGNFEIFIIKGVALGMLGDIQGTRKNFDYALSMDKSEEVNILLNITSILQNLNHYELLIPYLERLANLEPHFSSHLYDLGFANEKLGHNGESIKYYNRYLEQEPFSDSAWYNMGIIYNKQGNNGKALEAYEYALAVNPENSFALFNKGNLLSNLGRFREALEVYLEYLEFEDESSEALTYAAECYDKLGKKDLAVKLYNEAIDLDPDFSEPWFGLGIIFLNDNKFDDSICYFKRAVNLDMENPEYWYFLGKSYYRMSDIKNSVKSFREALKLDPFYDIVWSNLGHIIISEKLYSRVTGVLERALKVIGDIHGLRFLLASAYLFSGQNEKCTEHLSLALLSTDKEFYEFEELLPRNMLNDEQIEMITKKFK
ncbi:MAG TPA: tetratricopeptide repeat protein [Bacteroidales bacterium]|nr:tetratricopeptide repeat protein [Bacteroidales bacterium]